MFIDDKPTARRVLQQVGPRRIATQIEPDGRMPYELARTKSFNYTHMNLRGFLHLARLAEHVDVDLWTYRSEDKRSIEAALEWLEPYVAGRKTWTHQQITGSDPLGATPLYRRVAQRLDKPGYGKLGAKVKDPVEDVLWPTAQP